MNVEIECPYCERVHVYRIALKPKVEEDSEKPHDEETGDLKEHQEEKN